MVTFIIIRHGYSQFNKEKRYTGQLDIPLTSLGRQQAEQTAAYLLKHFHIDAIYSSDLSRAIDTAKPIAEALSLPIQTEPDLRELLLGDWEGRLIAEVQQEEEFQQRKRGIYEKHDKETPAELLKRAQDVLHRIALENENKNVLIATHGGFVRSIFRKWLKSSDPDAITLPGNASISVVNYDINSKGADILLMGYDGHLDNE